jgi:hypothetical protein
MELSGIWRKMLKMTLSRAGTTTAVKEGTLQSPPKIGLVNPPQRNAVIFRKSLSSGVSSIISVSLVTLAGCELRRSL